MKRLVMLFMLCGVCTVFTYAQRPMEVLDRGLVAVRTAKGVYIGWRILGEEYYDVTYNIYRDGVKLNDIPLLVSNYEDKTGGLDNSYTVSAVVRGVEQASCAAVTPWESDYYEMPLSKIACRNGADVTAQYQPNDCSVADLDGDGQMEIIVKRLVTYDENPLDNDSVYDLFEAYRLDGTLLWRVDLGPNMVSGGSVESDVIAYDWDEDGKAEVLFRTGGNSRIYYNALQDTCYVGSETENTRSSVSWVANMTYTNTGSEYLVYMNGVTGEPYVVTDYPLPRGLASDWGDSYGHRCSKYYFGAPFLDGRHASIFLARGCYTKHNMIAYDVDKATHQLIKRWYWTSETNGGIWWGQGYHNFGVADVDYDGRDEIVFGSMVIDDNGNGLSSTGLGHGDAQHCGDFDPYRHGQEIMACNEANPGSNYRDATTSEIYYRCTAAKDDGRCMVGNFTDSYPGCMAFSTRSDVISTVTDKALPNVNKYDGTSDNFRIYWDGDLLEETFNYGYIINYLGYDPVILKYHQGTIKTFSGTLTCNASKGTPCVQADLFGDWREEVVLRTEEGQSLRFYTTTDYTPWRNYTLLHDMQYRQAIVWQICAYNQPPHTSYFLGETEGITVAPPPLMNNGRVELSDGAAIDNSLDDKHVLLAATDNMTVSVADGASPYILTDNAPTWVQGHDDNNNITTTTYTHTLTGGALTGAMRLVKQGDGVLVLPDVEQTFTGRTDVWAGTLRFNGSMPSSHVWLNRFARLDSHNGIFPSGIDMSYASELMPGGEDRVGLLRATTLNMDFGSRLVIDVNADDKTNDTLFVDTLRLITSEWTEGPEYLTPVIEFNLMGTPERGIIDDDRYLIVHSDTIIGGIDDIIVEGLSGVPFTLSQEKGDIYLNLKHMRNASSVIWTGEKSSVWDLSATDNFTNAYSGASDVFVTDDKVTFNDGASNFNVTLENELQPDTVLVTGGKNYTFTGDGQLRGDITLLKEGKGKLVIGGDNSFTGSIRISGGILSVASLSNKYLKTASLGSVRDDPSLFVIENGATLQTTSAVEMGSPITIDGSGAVSAQSDFIMDAAFSGDSLVKKGTGNLSLAYDVSLKSIEVQSGTLSANGHSLPPVTILSGGTLQGVVSGHMGGIYVKEGTSSRWNLDSRCWYGGSMTGSGTVTVYCPIRVNGISPRTQIASDWSAFEGTVIVSTYDDGTPFQLDNSNGLPLGTLDDSEGKLIINSGQSYAIGKIIGDNATLGGAVAYSQSSPANSNTWLLGNDENYSWKGLISGTGTSFTKIGTGRLTLTGAHDYTGATTVEEGELHIASGAALGTGKLTVSEGAIFSGVTSATGSLNNSSFIISGTLQVGLTPQSTTGRMNMGGKTVYFRKGSTYLTGVKRSATSASGGCAYLDNVGTLMMNGTVSIFLDDSYTPSLGDSVRIWQCEKMSGSPTFDLPSLPDSLSWDTSSISSGWLRIVAADLSAVRDISATDASSANVYDLKGCIVSREGVDTLPKGIYIINGKKIIKK